MYPRRRKKRRRGQEKENKGKGEGHGKRSGGGEVRKRTQDRGDKRDERHRREIRCLALLAEAERVRQEPKR